jgi:hypothetical protein
MVGSFLSSRVTFGPLSVPIIAVSGRHEMVHERLRQEHQPSTITEHMLVEKMAQHFWLSQRAQKLADLSMDPDIPNIDHDEAALSQRAEDSKIGFESQEHKRNEEARKQAAETRKQELHSWRVLLAEAEAERRILLNHQLETSETKAENLAKTLKVAS